MNFYHMFPFFLFFIYSFYSLCSARSIGRGYVGCRLLVNGGWMGDWVVAQQLALTCSKYLIISSGCVVILYSTHIPDFLYVCVAYVYTTVRLYLPVCLFACLCVLEKEGGRDDIQLSLERTKMPFPSRWLLFFLFKNPKGKKKNVDRLKKIRLAAENFQLDNSGAD